MKKGESVKGIKGWLFLLAVITYFSAFYFLNNVVSLFNSNLLFSGIEFLLFAFNIFVLILIHKRNKETPKFIMILLWLGILHAFLIEVVPSINSAYYGAFYNYDVDEIYYKTSIISSFIINSILTILWTVYLLSSQRVANTFNNKRSVSMTRLRDYLFKHPIETKTKIRYIIIVNLILLILIGLPLIFILFFGSLPLFLEGIYGEEAFNMLLFGTGLFGITISIIALIYLIYIIIHDINKKN